MSGIDDLFAKKCLAFSKGEMGKVAASLAEASYVTVGQNSFTFQDTAAPTMLLCDYHSGLSERGYAHSLHNLHCVERRNCDLAFVSLDFTHLDWEGQEIDTFAANYILKKDGWQRWKCFFVEFPKAPIAFPAQA